MSYRRLAVVFLSALTLMSPVRAQRLNGAGATFPNPIYAKWFYEYSLLHPGVQINYQSIGSGAGIRQASQGILDFGASDGPMTDRQMAESRVRLFHIPTVLGAVVPVYHVPGVTAELQFSGDVIADIYLGKITRWNDARIQKQNPSVLLPDHAILPVYRSDGSGTTYIFTDYLTKVSPAFAATVGRNTAVRWNAGVGQKGNEGVAGMVRNSAYAFGYVELSYAAHNGMTFGSVLNAAGNYRKASIETVMAAAAGAAEHMPADFRVSITNAPGSDSYPISSFTWLLIPVRSSDPAKGRVLVDFLQWMLDHGEQEAGALSYAPLPDSVASKVRAALREMH